METALWQGVIRSSILACFWEGSMRRAGSGVVTPLKEEHENSGPRVFQTTATTSCHMFIAAARKARCVLAEMRWRWTLKVLYVAA